MWDALNQAIEMAEQDPEARVIMVRGKGKSFYMEKRKGNFIGA